jgi:HlyD family secretion protein
MKARAVLPVVLITAAAGTLWAFRHRGAEALTFSGTIEARDVEVGSLTGGRVAVVHADEGDTVKKGQPLVTFETDLVEAQVSEQAARVAESEAALTRALNGPRQEERATARAQYEEAERERRRLKTLLDEGVLPRAQYDESATRARVAEQALRQLERGTRAEDIAAAHAARERERSRLDYLRRQQGESVVTAPGDGTVETMDLRPGDLVPANRPVATILEPHQMWVRVYVPEPRLGLVHVGQEATFTVDTFPGRAFRGKVVDVSNRAEYTPRNVQTLDQRSEQVFGVKIEIEPSPEIKPGMSALVRLAS